MPASLDRLRRMDAREIRWRVIARTRAAANRARCAIVPSHWRRRRLARELAADGQLNYTRVALERGDWDAAQEALAWHFASTRQRFLIAPRLRADTSRTIEREFPGAAADAAARADRIVDGEYDLLGYRRLRYDGWHHDPVSGRGAPRLFWTRVPFLDPSVGDHKVIWELNRHQHWLALGRAYWLVGDPRYRTACLSQLASWMGANPPLVGINWASMLELAFRSLSWMWALHFFAEPRDRDATPWLVDLLTGLVHQLDHVEQNLSYYFSPNTHLLGEALALYVAGRTLPELRASERWTATGRSILLHEIDRQIGEDGGHAERSAHYQKYTLDFYLMALAIARISGDDRATIERFELTAGRLATATRLLADDRGRLPLFGDDDGGALAPICGRAPDDARASLAIAAALLDAPDLRIAAPPEEAYWFLAHPTLHARLERVRASAPPAPVASGALPATGYYVSRSTGGDHLVIDAGPHGYQNGGHAHADALSLTLTVRTQPLLIDPGTGCYTIDPVTRDRFRSTALHNTVTIDGRPQSIPRGPFHWSHTAAGTAARWRANGAFDYLDATHDGYAPIEHRRHVLMVHRDLLMVADLIDYATAPAEARASGRNASGRRAKASAAREHSVRVHWHLDPHWSVDAIGDRARLSIAGDRIELVVPGAALESFTGDGDSGLGWHAPVYGRVEPTTTLRASRSGELPLWIVSVFGLHPDLPIDRVEQVPVWCEAGVLSSSLGLRIARGGAVDHVAIGHRADASQRQDQPDAPGRGATWRVGEFETDAHLLFCRVRDDGSVGRVALVDGSLVRAGGRRVAISLPRTVSDLNVDLAPSGDRNAAPEARLSGPGFGARIVAGGRELPIAIERRASPRGARSSVPVNE